MVSSRVLNIEIARRRKSCIMMMYFWRILFLNTILNCTVITTVLKVASYSTTLGKTKVLRFITVARRVLPIMAYTGRLRLNQAEGIWKGRGFTISVIYRGYYTVARRYEFYFRVAKQYFTTERSEWVIYCFCHEKIKFISTSRRVMFFLWYWQKKDIDKVIDFLFANAKVIVTAQIYSTAI